MSVTTTILKEHIETDLSTAAIQRLIDDADSEITRRYGSDTAITEHHLLQSEGYGENIGLGAKSPRKHIFTSQKITSVTSVKEGPTLATADLTTLTLNAATNGYRLILNNYAIERIGTDFDRCVEIIYAPVTDVKRRDRVTIDLVRLAIQYNALKSEGVGDWNGSYVDYQKERESILSTLNAGRRSFA
jgi:hypothetical protein